MPKMTLKQLLALTSAVALYIVENNWTGDFQLDIGPDDADVVFEMQEHGDVITVDRAGNVTTSTESYAD